MYQIYVTDCLRILGENTSKIAGGSYFKARWIDMVHPKPAETRTSEEIIAHMKQLLGGETDEPT